MKKNVRAKIILFSFILILAIIAGIVIQVYDNRYRNFFIEKRPLGDVVSEAPSIEPDYIESSEEEKVYVNINTDSISELDKLDGIGEALAKRIINYRKEHGNFEVIEDIMRVSGIGEKKFENIKDNIYVK